MYVFGWNCNQPAKGGYTTFSMLRHVVELGAADCTHHIHGAPMYVGFDSFDDARAARALVDEYFNTFVVEVPDRFWLPEDISAWS